MTGLCLGLAALIQLSLPIDHFTVAWMHSVEKIPWEEDYRIERGRIVPVVARIQGAGAGMDFPDDAVWKGGYWEYRPHLPPLERLRLTRSRFTSDYQLCWDGQCRTFTDLLGPASDGTVVELFACPAATPATKGPNR
jgi:hypothetical protein